MASLTTAVVGLNVQCLAPGPVGSATADQVLIINLDAQNTVNLGSSTTNLAFPLAPQSSIALSAPVFAAAATMPLVVGIAPGGSSFFQPASLANIGGSKVYVQDTAPTGKIPANSIWFNTAISALETWNGTEWVTQQFSAQELIQDSTILAAQIAAGTLTAAQLAAAAGILGSQIASATITSGNIAANTIVAANIAANTITAAKIAAGTITAGQIAANTITASQIATHTITAAQLAAGIVYAGIVDATTINAATFIGSVFEGSDWVINTKGEFLYSGTPAAGNLIASNTNTLGDDGFGNYYLPGYTSYIPIGGGGGYIATEVFSGAVSYWFAANMVSVTNPWAGLGDITAFNGTPNILQLTPGPNTGDYIGIAGAVKVTGGFHYSGPIVAYAPGGMTDETWHAITPDSGWSGTTPAGYATPAYRMLPDGNVQLSGILDRGSGSASTFTINNSNPLPAAYRPASTKYVRMGDAVNRFDIMIAGGVLTAEPATSAATNRYAELDSTYSLR